MPRLVDHAARRHEIITATWRLIARRGIDAATLRDISHEVGLANGALTHYFRTKDDLLQASFEHVYDQTNERVRAALQGRGGLSAVRAFCHEVLPLDEARVLEAKIVLPFWGRMATDARFARVYAAAMSTWREQVTAWLRDARAAGEVTCPTPDGSLADELLGYLMGAQVLVLADPSMLTPARQLEALDVVLDRLH